ncbi:hypothetical protein D9V37_04980 [Nocardioides mangrovicus]|uniref:Uncharacterized protein n=1 Tax=Nocardioides mangrovicus TaxID=2478913 RepID=A0A3L8P5Q6_9ACTN|nr:hypothetical protein [Nocardioides mangrovicus]RLV50404.1 hypothetical protein D9V37_04980 [Nocardioides mangrovicus]
MSSGLLRLAGGFATTREAEHAYDGSGGAFVATVFDPVDQVVIVSAENAQQLPDRARLFVFPGHEQLSGTLEVAALLELLDEVRSFDGTVPGAQERVETQRFVRPLVEAGRTVLVLRPYDDGTDSPDRAAHVPFEQPNPTPCCANH